MNLFTRRRGSLDDRLAARKSLITAKEKLGRNKEDVMKHSNEFARNPMGVLELEGKSAQLASSRAWYNFWEQSGYMPDELEMWTREKVSWSDAANSCMEEILEAAEETCNWSSPQKVFWTGDTVYEVNKIRSKNGVPFLRMRSTLCISPKLLLLTQIRADIRGMADDSLMYMRDHFTFRDGRAHLFHCIRGSISLLNSPRDFCDLTSWDEHPDGTIVVASTAVLNCVPKKLIAKCVQGQNRITGMVIRPKLIETKSFLGSVTSTIEACEVILVCSVDPGGWAPKSMFNQKKEMARFLSNCERTGKDLQKSGKATKLVKRHILRCEESS